MSNFTNIQVSSDGTFAFHGELYRIQLPNGQALTPTQAQQVIQQVGNLLNSASEEIGDLNGMLIQAKSIHFQDHDIQYVSPEEQEILQNIQEIAKQALALPPSSPALPKKVSQIPPLPELGRKKKEVPANAFSWPSESVKNKLFDTAQSFYQYIYNLKRQGTWNPKEQALLEKLEQKLEEIQTFQKGSQPFDQTEFTKFIAWGKEVSNRLKEKKYDKIPLFFKNEFNQWSQQLSQYSSWEEVQKIVHAPIEAAYEGHLLDDLFRPESSDQERQLGQILLDLPQADHPRYLQKCLQTADNLYASLEPKQRQALQPLLQELHKIVDASLDVSPSLVGRVKSLPSYSNWDKFKVAIGLIFAGIGKFFQRHSTWTEAQKTPAYLEAEHCDFDGELVGREEVLRHDTVSQLVASKKAQLQHLKAQNPPPRRLISELEKEIALYERYQKDKTWVTANQLRQDFSLYHKAQKKNQIVEKPENTYLPAIVNSRIHQITTETESLAIHRSGALSYLLDGSTNLLDLQDDVRMKWKDKIPPSQSFVDFKQKALEYLQANLDPQLYLALERIEKRQQALDDQMVQYVANQVQAHIADLVDPSRPSVSRLSRTIQLTQISLLNPQKQSKESSGLQINENNQMLDMAALFQQFNGKEVQFKDVSAPFMDGQTIYLPLSFLKDPQTNEELFAHPDIAEPFTLACTFFNTSVQGLKQNEGDQQIINEMGLEQLERNFKTLQEVLEKHPEQATLLNISLSSLRNRFKQVKDRLRKGETGYEMAKDLTLLQHDMQGMLGVNCFSGKDRTGYLVALVTGSLLAKQIDQRKDLSLEEKEALKRKLQRDLMDMETGLASQVVHQNTGHKVLKIQERSIKGINAGEGFFGDLIRLGHALFAASAQA